MTRIDNVFGNNKKSLILYTCGGDPDLNTSIESVGVLEKYADIIELGIPFSDPLADGPVIQKAHYRALSNKIKIKDVLQISTTINKPVLIMTYTNPIYKYGIEKFFKDAENCNVGGVIVVDLPPDEDDFVTKFSNGADVIFMLSRNSNEKRIKLISEKSTGFIYVTSVFGTTGVRGFIDPTLKDFSSRVKRICDKPLALGFGISMPHQIKQTFDYGFDAAIVGSAIINLIEQGLNDKHSMLDSIDRFCKSLRTVI